MTDEIEALAGVLPERLQLALDVAVQNQFCTVGQIVEQRGRLFEKERQVVFDAGRGHTVADVAVERDARRVTIEALAPASTEGGACGLIQRKLAAGQQVDFPDRIEAALGVGVEGAQALEFVIEEVQPVGQGRAHGEQVDETAPYRVFAGTQHLFDVFVTGQRELRFQGRFINLHALGELEGARGQPRRRCQTMGGRAGRHQQHIQLALLQAVQRRQPLGHQILMGREAVVGQGFPVGQARDGQFGRKPGDFCREAAAVGGLRAYNDVSSARRGCLCGGSSIGTRAKMLRQQPGIR